MTVDGTRDCAYTLDVQREVLPAYLTHAARLHGMRPPDPEGPMTWLELGCGQGLGVVMTAAMHPHASVHGLDREPGHIAHARALAAAAGLDNATLHARDLSEVASCPEAVLPLADGVVAHGLYTWMPPALRERVDRVLARRVAAGGMVYLGYNCLPGWAPVAPLQRFVRERAARAAGPARRRLKTAFNAAEDLRDAGASCFTSETNMAAAMDDLAGRDATYLVHELLGDAWQPLTHAEVARTMAAAGLNPAGTANPVEAFPDLAIPQAARPHVDAAPDATFAALVLDLAVNRSFRRDLFARASAAAASDSRDPDYILLAPPDHIDRWPGTPSGPLAVDAGLLETLAAGAAGSARVAARNGFERARVEGQLAALTATGAVHPRRPAPPQAAFRRARRLNAVLARRAATGTPYRVLAAPAAGTAVPAGLDAMLCVDALMSGTPPEAGALGAALDRRLDNLDEPLVRGGQPVTEPRQRAVEARERAAALLTETVPVWRPLGVLPPTSG